MSTATPPIEAQMVDWFRMILAPDQVVELRTVPPGRAWLFRADRVEEMVSVALKLKGFKGVYFTLNTLDPSMLEGEPRAANDGDVLRRTLLMIDADPDRPADVSSTDAEKAEAEAVIRRIRDDLRADGWPEPILADSGNGWHLDYRIDLPADDQDLVKRCLLAIAARYGTPAVDIDTTVFNPSRICKFYGTIARKGRPTDERPHRRSRVLELPTSFDVVPGELLEALADGLEPPKPDPPTATVPPRGRSRAHGGDGPLDAVGRAGLYLDRCEPAIAGSHGHNKAFKAACKAGPGFDLPPDVALRLLRDRYNPRCEPPWSEKELEHKVRDAYKVEGRRGWLLDAPRNGHAQESRHDPLYPSYPSDPSNPSYPSHPGPNGKSHGPDVDYGKLSPSDLGMIRATDVSPKAIEWLWKYRLARGAMALLAGDGGIGKSQVLLAIAAAVTTGGEWPDGSGRAPLGDVVILSAEDRPEDTILPRLMALGADLGRVTIVRARVTIRRPGKEPTVHPMDFQRPEYWRAIFDHLPDCKLFIVDPLPSYLGRGVNDSKNSEIRAVLEPFLSEIVEPRGLCMLCNTHLNKSTDAKTPVGRIVGSIAYANLPRNVHLVVRDPEDPARRYFSQAKCNNAPDGLPSMAFRVERRDVEGEGGELIETAVPVFEPDLVKISLQELVNGRPDRDRMAHDARDAVGLGTEWLKARLADGPVGSAQCAREGEAALGHRWPDAGLPPEEYRKAALGRGHWWREKVLKPKLGGRSRKLGMGQDTLWFFTLPDHAWPPSGEAIAAARRAEGYEGCEGSEGYEGYEEQKNILGGTGDGEEEFEL